MPTLRDDYGDAVLSDDGVYRYELRRVWDPTAPGCGWVLLNPSTADAHQDDPTIRRCARLARAWGYGGILVVNLYALRTTDPRWLRGHPDPVGPHNDHHIRIMATVSTSVICAWGTHPLAAHRAPHVQALLHQAAPHLRLHCVGRASNGAPRHPLYAPTTATPVPLRAVTE